MKVFDLRCAHDHRFEGWFASDDEFQRQLEQGLVECPVCADRLVSRLPSAPRLNLSGAQAPRAEPPAAAGEAANAATVPPDLHAAWLQAVRHVLSHTEDVGERFPEEARRIHYGEVEHRGIRGQVSAEERAALLDEGIEVMPLPLPAALKGPVQ